MHRGSTLFALALSLLAAGVAPGRADDLPLPRLSLLDAELLVSTLQWKTGTIALPGGQAQLNLADSFRFLARDDARKVLHQIWRNPDIPSTLGLIFPANLGPLDREGWAVMLEYDDRGYIKDNDADKINYTDLLHQMQSQSASNNQARQKAGYPPVTVVGWASPPHYDKLTHKLYWAKDLKIGDPQAALPDTLNYDIRILGRKGWLVMTAIGNTADFDRISEQIPALLASVEFLPGYQYQDFNPKVDKIAEYGLATLVAGGALGAAAKLGLLGLVWKYLLIGVFALKKLIVLVIAAGVALYKKFRVWLQSRRGVQRITFPSQPPVPPTYSEPPRFPPSSFP